MATLIVTFAGVTCRLGTPAAPTVTQATCATGAVTVPTVVLASSPGITYLADPPGPYDGTEDTTVTVTATVHDGYGWEQMPTGWTEVNPATATFTVELAGASVRRGRAGGAGADRRRSARVAWCPSRR